MVVFDPGETVFALTEKHPGLVEVLAAAGFPDVKIPVVRQTAGRVMTLEQGIIFKGLSPDRVYRVLEEAGFQAELPIMGGDEK